MLTKFKKGTDLLLLNTVYNRPKRQEDGNYSNDVLYLIYKNLENGEKYIEKIERPEIDIYMAKENIEVEHNLAFIEKDYTDTVTVPYKDTARYIAELADKRVGETKRYTNYYWDCINNREYWKTNMLHRFKYVFGSDMDIEDYYRIKFFNEYGEPSKIKLKKAFLDIEVDSIDIPGFPEPGECPINAVTFIVDDNGKATSYTFLLENDKIPEIDDIKKDVNKFIDNLHTEFDDSYGDIDYNILFYKDEAKMLIDLFRIINAISPDFLLIWNASFDIPYIMMRLGMLGYNPSEVMCDREFKNSECYFIEDKNTKVFEKKGDAFIINAKIVYMDQLINYASLRIGGNKPPSYSLNTIAQIELKDEKLDYSEEANIKTLPYVNYMKFVMYNIKDVLLQLGLERKNSDIDAIYYSAMTNFTRYAKIFKQSVFLKNRAYYEFLLQGYIIGNNINTSGSYEDEKEEKDKTKDENNEDDDDNNNEKFEGALVGDPLLNDNHGMVINGRKSKFIFENAIDYDFASMYPNIIATFNIFSSTQYGRALINDQVYKEEEERYKDESRYDRAGEFLDNVHTKDYIQTGSRWFNLPTLENMITELSGKKAGRVVFTRRPRKVFRRIDESA